MLITTIMLGFLVFQVWKWNRLLATLVIGTFLLIDGVYFASNITKIPDGGWFPLVVAAVGFIVLTTWATGRQLMRKSLEESAVPLKVFVKSAASAFRARGTAVFMSSSAEGIPSALLHNLKHNQVVHERVIILTVKIEGVPHIDAENRIETEKVGSGFYRVILHYGFMEEVDIPGDLQRVKDAGGPFDMMTHQLLPRPPEAHRQQGKAGHGAVAREAVRLDAQELGERDGILPPADQPRHRARQPGADLMRAAFALGMRAAGRVRRAGGGRADLHRPADQGQCRLHGAGRANGSSKARRSIGCGWSKAAARPRRCCSAPRSLKLGLSGRSDLQVGFTPYVRVDERRRPSSPASAT